MFNLFLFISIYFFYIGLLTGMKPLCRTLSVILCVMDQHRSSLNHCWRRISDLNILHQQGKGSMRTHPHYSIHTVWLCIEMEHTHNTFTLSHSHTQTPTLTGACLHGNFEVEQFLIYFLVIISGLCRKKLIEDDEGKKI